MERKTILMDICLEKYTEKEMDGIYHMESVNRYLNPMQKCRLPSRVSHDGHTTPGPDKEK